MFAKVLIRRSDARRSFRSLIEYVTRADEECVPEIETFTSCLSLDTAHAEMRAVADRNVRVRGPVFHFVICWREGEQPGITQVFEAGRTALEAIGMAHDEHQHVFAIHRDPGNVHLHVVVNRVNLHTGRAVNPGLSYFKLDRCMRELELRQGWQHNRGSYVIVERDGQHVVERDMRSRKERQSRPARARDMEAFSGMESLATYACGTPRRDVLAQLSQPGVTWQDVHAVLARHGLELRIKGPGLAIYAKGREHLTPVKASSVDERLGRRRLEEALGPWVEPTRVIRLTDAERSYVEREIDVADAPRREARARMRVGLRAGYDYDGTRQRAEFDTARRELRSRHAHEYRTLLERHQKVRERIRGSGFPAIERKAAFSVSAFERARELEALRERQIAERKALKRPQTYREWVETLAQQGDEAAIAQLRSWTWAHQRRRSHVPVAEPGNWIAASIREDIDPFPPARAGVKESWTWRVDTRTGNVEYQLMGERQFVDEGWRVRFHSNDAQRDTMLAGLLLARQKFGSQIDVTGSEHFRERTAALAATYRLDITFGDVALEAMRLALIREQQERENARATPNPHPVAQPEWVAGSSPERGPQRESGRPSMGGPDR
ncbi:TraI/MobA(P) family conjugative relaxase [Paraburkholderia sacchari]|uniref:TraI/MobA(P) family conjugative relaxase n=1 Tax=Paraburkholderia sacchari TaxID=159450 RepID=UPI001BCD79E3|nr:TraI/MobA(P) family conjugative relaxase [Paraburkholderia sacchari]